MMKTKFKALIGFARLKDDELVVLASTVINAMTDNANFAQPSPSLADVQVRLEDFVFRLAAARKRGSPEETALKDESRIPLETELQKLAYYVNSVANGHLSTLLSSGFPTNNERVSALVPFRVEGVKMSDGRQSGQARLDFMKQRNVLMYEYQYRKVGEPNWSNRMVTSSSRANIIAPLEAAQRYEARVRAINTQGVGDWSDTAELLVR